MCQNYDLRPGDGTTGSDPLNQTGKTETYKNCCFLSKCGFETRCNRTHQSYKSLTRRFEVFGKM
jgi:hypothetical protein